MLKAILRQGAIVPLEPLPPDWQEGAVLEVAKADVPDVDIDQWAETMEELCTDSAMADEEVMRQAILAHRREAKAQVRQEMGLSA